MRYDTDPRTLPCNTSGSICFNSGDIALLVSPKWNTKHKRLFYTFVNSRTKFMINISNAKEKTATRELHTNF